MTEEEELRAWREWGKLLPYPLVIPQAMKDDPRAQAILDVVPHVVSRQIVI